MTNADARVAADWLTAALLQVAAESHLDGISLSNRDAVLAALERGSNRPGFSETQFIRMTRSQAESFLDRFELLHHHGNDQSGFSATLLRNRSTGAFTLAFRSTEPQDSVRGGDFERDGITGADGQISRSGFAIAQLASMENLLRELRTGPLSGVGQIDIVGYSLGAHLALLFTELHPDLVARTTVFNAAGRGQIVFPRPLQGTDTLLIPTMLDLYRSSLLGEPPQIGSAASPSPLLRAARRAFEADQQLPLASRWNPLATADLSRVGADLQTLYTHPRHLWATKLVDLAYSFEGPSFGLPFGQSATGRTDLPGYVKVTQIYGHAMHGDIELAANSGIHPPATPIFVEGQPPLEGTGGQWLILREPTALLAGTGDYAGTHSLVLIIDTLEVMRGFMRADPTTDKRSVEAMLAAASNERPRRFFSSNASQLSSVESNSLELATDALRRLYFAPATTGATFESERWFSRFVRANGSYGDIQLRTELHGNLALLGSTIDTKGPTQLLPLVPLAVFSTVHGSPLGYMPREDVEAGLRALARSPDGIAYRYALRQLDPFVALGNDALFGPHNTLRELDLFDPDTSPDGGMTGRYIDARAQFLGWVLTQNVADEPFSLSGTGASLKFVDRRIDRAAYVFPLATASTPRSYLNPERYFDSVAASGAATRIVGFAGPAGSLPLRAGSGDDELFGASGTDVLISEAGADYLEGGRGDDHLIAGSGNDTLFGGRGNDVLSGDLGFDTYIWHAGDGYDSVIDRREGSTGALGEILWRGESLTGTKSQYDAGNFQIFTDQRGLLYYVVGDAFADSVDLSIVQPGQSGGLLVRGFQSGDLGITLTAAAPPPMAELYGTDRSESLTAPGANYKVYGLAGDDTLVLTAGNVEGYGGPGNDTLLNGPGEQILNGESGDDNLIASSGRDELRGGLGQDFLQGGDDDDRLDGGPGDDFLAGGRGSDALKGGDGVDYVDGGSAATISGTTGEFSDPVAMIDGFRWSVRRDAAGNFTFRGFDQSEWIDDGGDVLDAGRGDDYVFGGYGDDLAYGGEGADGIIGGPGADTLYGDAGDDSILGGPSPALGNSHYAPAETDGSDYIDGGEGRDLVYGHAGADILLGADGDDELHGDFPELSVALQGGDYLSGGAGTDRLYGDAGDDTLRGDEGDDLLVGDDTTLASEFHGEDDLDGGAGDDQLFGQGGADVLAGGAGKDRLEGDSAETAAQYHGNDLLDGEAGDDILVGAGGNDTLLGAEGNDTLVGDASNLPLFRHGADELDGGDGNDELTGGGGEDLLAGAAGDDKLWGDEQGDADFGARDILDGGDGNDVLRGGGDNDILLGGAGDDQLFGDAGNDVLDGGPGNDVLQGGAGDDTYILRPGEGADRISDPGGMIDVTLGDSVALPGVSAAQGGGPAGPGLPFSITVAGGGSLRIDGPVIPGRLRVSLADGSRLGADELLAWSALAPAERIAGTTGDDEISAPGGTTVLGLNGDDLLLGSGRADTLYGGEGSDQLDGAGGNDVLIGGLGDDVYILGAGHGADIVRESPGAGDDTLFVEDGIRAADVRLRRSGDDLLVRLSVDGSQATIEDWFVQNAGTPRGIDTIDFAESVLDPAMIEARVLDDVTLHGTDADDILQGDELRDILVGARGNDQLRGLGGDDHYRIAAGDGNDTIVDTGGFDTIEFGIGITAGEIDLEARTRSDGSLEVQLTIAGSGGHIAFGAAREERIEAFRFADGTSRSFAELVDQVGGLRQNGSEADDTLGGGYYADALYGHGGDDTLWGDPGADVLSGGAGDDQLAGGANNDTYVFQPGDGRDRIVEFHDRDEYLIFGAQFSATGERFYVVDGIAVRARGPIPSPQDEVFNITLGTVHGGDDTIAFGEGISPESLLLGLRLLDERRPYSVWNAEDPPGTLIPGASIAYAEQAAYVLDLGGGDSIEIVRPLPSAPLAALQDSGIAEGDVPVEHLVFASGETLTIPEVYALTGGYAHVTGTAGADRFTTANLRSGGALIGQAGDDVYVAPELASLTVLEEPGGGIDTIEFEAATSADDLLLVFDQTRLMAFGASGSVTLGNFVPSQAHTALVERFVAAGGTLLPFEALLGRGIEIPGSLRDDVLSGTSAQDRISAGGGNDRIDGMDGDDRIEAGPGDDIVDGGGGSDRLRGGSGRDRLQGGGGADVFEYGEGDGEDVILAAADAVGSGSTLAFDAGIDPGQVGVARASADLILNLSRPQDQITLERWFDGHDSRVGRITFGDGTVWDAASLAAMATTEATAGGNSEPPSPAPGAGSTGTTPPGPTAAGEQIGAAATPESASLPLPAVSGGVAIAGSGPLDERSSPGETPQRDTQETPEHAGRSAGAASVAVSTPPLSGSARAPSGAVELAGTAQASLAESFSEGPRHMLSDAWLPTAPGSASGLEAVEEAELRALAERWFAPSHHAGHAEETGPTVGQRSATHAPPPGTGPVGAVAWEWAAMHASLDRELHHPAAAGMATDLVEPMESTFLRLAGSGGLGGGPVGLLAPTALDLRPFAGLQEGLNLLG